MEQEEIWKDIAGYERLYQVSNLGRVKSVERTTSDGRKWSEKILKPRDNSGYLLVSLCKNGILSSKRVHRLVATAFIPNNDMFATVVNHKNEDKADNRVENLEWMTQGDNSRYSNAGPSGNYWRGKHPRAKLVRCVETDEIFACARDASISLGVTKNAVSSCIRNGCRCGGYHWEYVEKDKQTKQQ